MWVCFNDSFLSIVWKECERGELLVRARRPGDIEKVFGRRIKVRHSKNTDYAYRAVVSKEDVKAAMSREVDRITYSNFKDSIPPSEDALHNAYLRVWTVMSGLQPTKPYGGLFLPTEEPERMQDIRHKAKPAKAAKPPRRK
jgi:hypothetical protein